jgi:subtilisin family serine protease
MRKPIWLLLTVVVFALMLIPHASVYSGQPNPPRSSKPLYASDEILIKLREDVVGVTEADIPEQILSVRTAGAERLSPRERSGPYLVHLGKSISVEEAIAKAYQDPRVEYAEPNFYLYPTDTTPNDPLFSQMWGLFNSGLDPSGGQAGADIGAKRAWDITTGSDDVVIAVVDTGVDISHQDLATNVWVNTREIPGNGVDDDGNGFIDDVNGWNFFSDNNKVFEDPAVDGHGTHVAGTIGAVGNNAIGVTGVAWHVKLMVLKFMGKQENGKIGGSTANAVRAINYAIDQKKRGVNLRAINASWGGSGRSNALHDAIIAAGDAGILFVCAAGNGGDDGRGDDLDELPDYPAGWGSEISTLVPVAALDRWDNLALFSNYGHTTVSVGAPGISILSTVPNNGYSYLSGTSMSTPHVTGIAALLVSYDPSLGPAQIKQRIINTAQPVLALASKTVSAGRANAYNALTNRIPQPSGPAIASVQTTKKILVIDGLGFVDGSSVIEVNGAVLDGKVIYDDAFRLAGGTLTQLRMKLGKFGINAAFPQNVTVTVTVFNTTTGQRSAPFFFTRK